MLYILVNATHDGDDYLGVFSSEEEARAAAKTLPYYIHSPAIISQEHLGIAPTNPDYIWLT